MTIKISCYNDHFIWRYLDCLFMTQCPEFLLHLLTATCLWSVSSKEMKSSIFRDYYELHYTVAEALHLRNEITKLIKPPDHLVSCNARGSVLRCSRAADNSLERHCYCADIQCCNTSFDVPEVVFSCFETT
ncbi:unnamed protein product [Nippostrongylus brasiliensis]|uniref:Out at first protein homolog n=1 Tax=Nippostrongylus brasiliensis TaxID=27835 RepID=A0A0N4Y9D0_NIPBR|nr:unnamed protein product [Nippostrongylus brasiliensis]